MRASETALGGPMSQVPIIPTVHLNQQEMMHAEAAAAYVWTGVGEAPPMAAAAAQQPRSRQYYDLAAAAAAASVARAEVGAWPPVAAAVALPQPPQFNYHQQQTIGMSPGSGGVQIAQRTAGVCASGVRRARALWTETPANIAALH